MRETKSEAAVIFGARVREHRQKLGISQETLAQLSSVHWTFVGQVERGTRNLSLNNIIKIAAGLDIDPSVLVKGIDGSAVPMDERQPTEAERIRSERRASSRRSTS